MCRGLPPSPLTVLLRLPTLELDPLIRDESLRGDLEASSSELDVENLLQHHAASDIDVELSGDLLTVPPQ